MSKCLEKLYCTTLTSIYESTVYHFLLNTINFRFFFTFKQKPSSTIRNNKVNLASNQKIVFTD